MRLACAVSHADWTDKNEKQRGWVNQSVVILKRNSMHKHRFGVSNGGG